MTSHVRRLTRDDARRIAIRAQLLDASRPSELASVVERLTFLQLDPTAAVAPAAELVAWTRLGNVFTPADLRRAQEVERSVFEQVAQPSPKEPAIAMLRPTADLHLFMPDMVASRRATGRDAQWLADNDSFRRDVLDLLATSGPLTSREIPDSSTVSWQSTGWKNDRNVTQMLELLAARGEIAVSSRVGRERVWDVASRVFPVAVVELSVGDAAMARDERRVRALGIVRPKTVGDAGETVEVEGTKGVWRVDPEASADGFEGRTALLSPFDRLTHDRARAMDLWGFEYVLEMYKPKPQRRWGYFALPVLHDDQLVGKADITADRDASMLRVHALHEDVKFTKTMQRAIDAELESLATWLGLGDVRR